MLLDFGVGDGDVEVDDETDDEAGDEDDVEVDGDVGDLKINSLKFGHFIFLRKYCSQSREITFYFS